MMEDYKKFENAANSIINFQKGQLKKEDNEDFPSD